MGYLETNRALFIFGFKNSNMQLKLHKIWKVNSIEILGVIISMTTTNDNGVLEVKNVDRGFNVQE